MRRVCLALVLVLAFPFLAFAQTPVASGLDSLRWDHGDADLVTAQVVRFELCYDASLPCQTVTPTAAKFVPTAAQGGPPAAGNSAYKMLLPALTPALHTVTIKACNVDTCTNAVGSPLSFRFVVAPAASTNTQFIKGT